MDYGTLANPQKPLPSPSSSQDPHPSQTTPPPAPIRQQKHLHQQQQETSQDEQQQTQRENVTSNNGNEHPHSFFYKVRYITGVYMLNVGGTIAWIWGNFSVYTRSYMYSKLDNTSGVATPWTIALYYVGWCLGILARDVASRYMKRRYYVELISLILVTATTCLSYFTVEYSVVAFNITFGIIPGIGSGCIYCLQLIYVSEFVDKHLGLFMSGVSACTLMFSFILNELITYYLNPDNLEPDGEVGQIKVFTNLDIVDNVPHIFLYFSLMNLIFGVFGMLLMVGRKIEAGPEVKIQKEKRGTSHFNKNGNHNLSISFDGSDLNIYEKENLKLESSYSDRLDIGNKDSKSEWMHLIGTRETTGVFRDFTPKQALGTIDFYILWCVGAVTETTFITLSSYYKTFGLVEIPDDQFMTTVGSFLSVSVGAFTFVSGALVDRFGVKNCLIGHLSSLSLLLIVYPFTTRISGWLFFATTLAYGCLSFPFYIINSIAVLKIFGNQHYSTILGIINTSTIFNFILPIILDSLLDSFGFFGLFYYVETVAFVVLVIVAGFLKRV